MCSMFSTDLFLFVFHRYWDILHYFIFSFWRKLLKWKTVLKSLLFPHSITNCIVCLSIDTNV